MRTAPRLSPPPIPPSPEAAVQVGILANPKHGRTMRAYGRLVDMLTRERIPYRSATTTRQWPGTEQTSRLLAWGADLVIVLGGDGTLRALAPALATTAVPVLIIPTGTANVLSRHIGLRSTEQALQLAEAHLCFRPMPLGEVLVNEADCLTADGPRREHFVSLAGIGGDARAIAGRTRLPRPLGRGLLGYVYGAGRALFSPLMNARLDGPHAFTTDADGRGTTEVWSVMASKTARPAGPIPVFDRATVSSREFEFLAVELATTKPGDRLGEWARIAWDCVNRRPGAHPAMHYWLGSEVSISLEAPAPVQLDGDLIGDCRRLDLRAATRTLTVVAPPM